MKIAFVHDWLMGIGGDVRVLKAMHEMHPDAPIFCLTRDNKFTDRYFAKATIIPVFQSKRYRWLLPFMATGIESLDLSDYDLVISTGSIFSKGLVLRPKTYHINYCHSPTRQVWDLCHAYKRKVFQHFLRIWDRQASTRVDEYITNSEHVKERIKKYYHRDATVLYPPVQINAPQPPLIYKRGSKGEFLIVSRLFKHKNVDIAIKAFNKLGWELVIIGDGPEKPSLQSIAGPNVHILGNLSDDAVAGYFERCRAFILPQEEDFGIAPVEALMHGKPVLALRAGGALEYIQEGINGLFFDDPHEAILADGVRRLREIQFDPKTIQATAQKFSWQNFQSSFSNIINQSIR